MTSLVAGLIAKTTCDSTGNYLYNAFMHNQEIHKVIQILKNEVQQWLLIASRSQLTDAESFLIIVMAENIEQSGRLHPGSENN